jgi:ribosome-binding protein aMBF1 (putative translation factor)
LGRKPNINTHVMIQKRVIKALDGSFTGLNMPRSGTRAYSRYGQEAARLLGQAIRLARIERRLKVEDLAERAGISRGLVQRIERGDLGCAIGAVFETATIVGVRLFDLDQADITIAVANNEKVLTLLPQSVRHSPKAVRDDF